MQNCKKNLKQNTQNKTKMKMKYSKQYTNMLKTRQEYDKNELQEDGEESASGEEAVSLFLSRLVAQASHTSLNRRTEQNLLTE